MRENTPPRVNEIEDDDAEEIIFANDVPPDDDELEMEEITMEELEARYGYLSDVEENTEGRFSQSPERDDAILTFMKHKSAVFGCSLHPTRPLAATGGEDDRAYVWNINTCEVMLEITEHKDTVTDVHFSYDGTYLATGDMAGELFVHKLQESESGPQLTLRKVWEFSMGDMTWMCWHRAANVLMAGSENGEVYVWRIPSGDCKILPGEGVRCGVADLTGDGKRLFVGYTNGAVKLWDLKSCTVVMEVDAQNPMAQQTVILSVACEKDSPFYAAGAADGKIVFCTNSGPVGAVEADGSVEYLAFPPSNDLKIVASGTLQGQIAIWDYTKYNLRTLCDHTFVEGDNSNKFQGGITRLKWLSDHTLMAATMDGNVIAFDARSGARKFTLEGHMAEIYEMCYNPHENILLTVSEDHRAKIFNIPQLGD
ncbi:PREDICTED: angio-associated migratory cell protein-like [Rhagoletis zephyria]|uniref:angio-associated migratory cell protein-like n=2 Tax=Rhagoletis zephyria TaxID=28612 RepID=UPI00081178F1|nr:PREDICTED: angio-associated migratory cell protein-like [Rhagoletis zephyria]XP_017491090.1 PREDICTED: angio-associated migratory cell protein-like [Rhagoletis zephyria]